MAEQSSGLVSPGDAAWDGCQRLRGRLTAKFQKNLYRPHKAYIFLSIFSFLYIGFLGFLCYNGKGGIDYESEYIKI